MKKGTRYFAYSLSMLGAFLVTFTAPETRLIGFCAWLISNGLWWIDAYTRKDMPQFWLWMSYQGFTLLGVYSCYEAIMMI